MVDVSICIIHYNTPDLTLKGIESVFQYVSGLSYEIIVVDNTGPGSELPERLNHYGDRVTLISNTVNRYFSGGSNQAIYRAKGEYIFMLSPDAYLVDDSVTKLYNFIRRDKAIGAVEGTIINDYDNSISKTSSMEMTRFREFVRSKNILRKLFSPIYRKYSYSSWDRTSDKKVEVLCNAFVIFPTKLFIDFGGYNEILRMYFTEEYLSDQIRKRGLELWHVGDAKLQHAWSASTNKLPNGWIKSIYKADRDLYFSLKKYGI